MSRLIDFERPLVRRLALIAAIGCAALIAVLSLAPASDLPSVKWSDKINHLIAYLGLSVPLLIALGRQRWWLAIGLAAAYGGVMEFAQGALTEYRTPDVVDALANTLGACIGAAIAWGLSAPRR